MTYNSARRMIVHGYYSSIILSFLFGFTFQSLFFPQLQGLRVIHKSICRRMCFICPTFAYYNLTTIRLVHIKVCLCKKRAHALRASGSQKVRRSLVRRQMPPYSLYRERKAAGAIYLPHTTLLRFCNITGLDILD